MKIFSVWRDGSDKQIIVLSILRTALKDVRRHVDFLTAWRARQVGRNFHPQLRSNIAFLSLETEMTNPMYRRLKPPGARLASTVWSGQFPRECRKDSLFSITFLWGQIFLGYRHRYNFNLHKFLWYPLSWSPEQFVLFRLNKIEHVYVHE